MSVSQTGFHLVTNKYSYFWTIDSQEQKLHTELLWLHAKDSVHCSFQQHVQEYLANHLSFCSTSTFPLPSSLQTECQNYVRVLLVNKTEVITCGTNAFQPRCIAREVVTCVSGCAGFVETQWKGRRFNAPPVSVPRIQVGNLSSVLESVNGVARCPYDPRHNSTAVVTESGELYAATVIDFSGRDPVIYRSLGGMPPLRTAQYNSKWLNGTESPHNHTDVLFECHLFNCASDNDYFHHQLKF